MMIFRSILLTMRNLSDKFVQEINTHSFYFPFFHSRTVHLDIIRVFYLPTDAQENCFKKNIKIYIKTSPTCFGAITIIRERIIRACRSYSC